MYFKFLILIFLYFNFISGDYSCPASCQPSNDCQCASTTSSIPLEDRPMFVQLTFDDGIIPTLWPYYVPLLLNSTFPIKDARGCTPRATFYVTCIWTNYHYVQQMYQAGHEIAVHTITHTTGETTDEATWYNEIHEARAIISSMAQVPLNRILGFRAPFLQYNTDMYKILQSEGFLYDSSWSDIYNSGGTSAAAGLHFPFTFDYGNPMTCDTGICLTQNFPGLWEIPMNAMSNPDYTAFASMDPPATGDALLTMLKQNFDWSYTTNRSPFGMFYHGAWLLADPSRMNVVLEFLSYVASKPNVFFVTSQQIISYMKNPVPASQVHLNPDFACPVDIPTHPSPEVCNGIDDNLNGEVDEGVVNFCNYDYVNFYSCAPCPATYPLNNSTLQGFIGNCGDNICQNYESCANCAADCSCSSSTSGTSTQQNSGSLTSGKQIKVTSGSVPIVTSGSVPIATTASVPIATTASKSTTSTVTSSRLTTSTVSNGCVVGCSVSICGTDNHLAQVVETSSWTNGYCGNINIYNNNSQSSTSWTMLLTFSNPIEISSSWGFTATSCSDGTVWNIVSSESMSPYESNVGNMGFCASYSGNSLVVSARIQFSWSNSNPTSTSGGHLTSGSSPQTTGSVTSSRLTTSKSSTLTSGKSLPVTTNSITSGNVPSSSTSTSSGCISGCDLTFCTPDDGNAVLQVTSSWTGGYCANLILHNPSTTQTANSWSVLLSFGISSTITSGWGYGSVTSCSTNTVYKLVPPSWGSSINAGETINSIGFCVSYSGNGFTPSARVQLQY